MTKPPIRSIVILTGAGISAESGLATFRASDGLWCGHRVEDVATPEGFAANPALVHEFYNQRRAQLKAVSPNAAHHALARLAAEWPGSVLIITQNVDDLHDRASHSHLPKPGNDLIHMHGELKKARHIHSHQVMERIEATLESCDLFVSIGTSGNVYPAAGFVHTARAHGAWTIELNLEPSLGGSLFHEGRYGPATQRVPEFVEALLAHG